LFLSELISSVLETNPDFLISPLSNGSLTCTHRLQRARTAAAGEALAAGCTCPGCRGAQPLRHVAALGHGQLDAVQDRVPIVTLGGCNVRGLVQADDRP